MLIFNSHVYFEFTFSSGKASKFSNFQFRILLIVSYPILNNRLMTISKNRLQRNARDNKQQLRFFIVLGIITVLLIIVLYAFYS